MTDEGEKPSSFFGENAYRGLACIDMDGTLTEDRLIIRLGESLGILAPINALLEEVRAQRMKAFEGSEAIARLLKGVPLEKITSVAGEMRLSEGANEFVDFLKAQNYLVCIVTDSYVQAAKVVGSRLGIDSVWGNVLCIESGICTGELEMPRGCKGFADCQDHSVCKLDAMQTLTDRYKIAQERTIAIGDSDSDICMVRSAGLGIAYRAKSDRLRIAAKLVVDTDFRDVLEIVRNAI